MNGAGAQPVTSGRDQQRRTSRRGQHLAAQLQVVHQRSCGALVQRKHAGLAVLAGHGQGARLRVQGGDVEPDRFPGADPGSGHQRDQGVMGGCPDRRAQPHRRVQQGRDLGVGVDVGRGPGGRQQPCRRYLDCRVGRVRPPREAPDGRQPQRLPALRRPRWCGRERKGMRDGHRLRPVRGLHVVHEPGQNVFGLIEFESQAATYSQIVRDHLLEPAHAVPPAVGHGRANPASRFWSVLA